MHQGGLRRTFFFFVVAYNLCFNMSRVKLVLYHLLAMAKSVNGYGIASFFWEKIGNMKEGVLWLLCLPVTGSVVMLSQVLSVYNCKLSVIGCRVIFNSPMLVRCFWSKIFTSPSKILTASLWKHSPSSWMRSLGTFSNFPHCVCLHRLAPFKLILFYQIVVFFEDG